MSQILNLSLLTRQLKEICFQGSVLVEGLKSPLLIRIIFRKKQRRRNTLLSRFGKLFSCLSDLLCLLKACLLFLLFHNLKV